MPEQLRASYGAIRNRLAATVRPPGSNAIIDAKGEAGMTDTTNGGDHGSEAKATEPETAEPKTAEPVTPGADGGARPPRTSPKLPLTIMAVGFAALVAVGLGKTLKVTQPVFVGDTLIGPTVPLLLGWSAGWFAWIVGSLMWLIRRCHSRERGAPGKGTIDLFLLLPWTLLLLPSLITALELGWDTARYHFLAPASPGGCRVVAERARDGGELFYVKGTSGTLVESGVLWSGNTWRGADPFRDGTWSLRWDGETAILHVWAEDHRQVSVHGVAEPCQ
ncbi:MAG: hypothetical protein LBK95_05810 [Bifidobacteriaceae bacterium]|nr:hypothetical protein [Bifidobacteriaceae bacterium]